MFDRRLPLWYQLARVLRTRILNGQLAHGSRLPPEAQLAPQFGVSVITVRQAMKLLEEEALIVRRRGRGTFVTAEQLPRRRELKLVGTAATVNAPQGADHMIVLERGVRPVPEELRHVFQDTDTLSFFRRLRGPKGTAHSYAVDWVVPEYGAQVTDELLERFPMVKILRDVVGLQLGKLTLSLTAMTPSTEVASLLGIDLFAPVACYTATAADRSGRVVDVATIYHRADEFQFTIDIDVSGEPARGNASAGGRWELREHESGTQPSRPAARTPA
jgi:GntR family transcriptional regulator